MIPYHRFLAFICLLAVATASPASQIDLRLAVNFSGGNPGAAGTWELFAKSDGLGIFTLGVDLAEIDAPVSFHMPTGTVNGTDLAGFGIQINDPLGNGRRLITNQLALPATAAQQGVFYGVGTLDNGSPTFPGAQGGTNQIGPNLTSLTATQNVPCATTDPVWSTGVSVATGTFSAGDAPHFAPSVLFPMGSVLTSIGTLTSVGTVDSSVAFTTLVTNNLTFGVATGDYNGNGTVDAADYTVWRDNFGATVAAGTLADGDGNGVIDSGDYTVWTNNFGTSGSSSVAIPEPTTLLLLLLTSTASLARRP